MNINDKDDPFKPDIQKYDCECDHCERWFTHLRELDE